MPNMEFDDSGGAKASNGLRGIKPGGALAPIPGNDKGMTGDLRLPLGFSYFPNTYKHIHITRH